jgi:hypothetical protein
MDEWPRQAGLPILGSQLSSGDFHVSSWAPGLLVHTYGDRRRGINTCLRPAVPAAGASRPCSQAERDLARALGQRRRRRPGRRLFAAAIDGLHELSTPYQLAHGQLDHAGYLTRLGDAAAAAAATGEARNIAGSLRCQPLLDRAATSGQQESRYTLKIAALRGPGESPGRPGAFEVPQRPDRGSFDALGLGGSEALVDRYSLP